MVSKFRIGLSLKLIFVVLIVSFNNFVFANNLPSSLEICGDGAEWPPYIYWKRDSAGKKTNKIYGLTVELLSLALKDANIRPNFNLPPWKRCLSNVESGEDYLIAVGSSFSEERNKKFLFTDHYYEVTPMFFYVKKHYPNGFPHFSNSLELLKLGNVCGLSGYNYEGFMKGLKNKDVDMGTKSFEAVVNKTKNGGCIGFFARYEVLKGFKNLGKDFAIDSEILKVKLPNVEKEKFHMLISRKIKYAQKLKKILDKEFKNLRNNSELFKKHME